MSIQIQNLHKSYDLKNERLHILKGLNADIQPGHIVAVVGSSGSGKSTLLSLLAGLDKPDQGEIIIDGTNICQLSAEKMIQFRAQNIGIVFQQFHLVSHLTAFENVALPLDILGTAYSKDQILTTLDHVGLKDRADHKPSELSGGESQRVAIARALVTKPKLILADEPSGNLDTETGLKVMNLFFEQVKKSKTMAILVTHDMNLAQRCDHQFILKNGLFN